MDSCFFGLHDFWLVLFAGLSALFAGLIVAITFFANKNLSRISKYSNLQKDREIVEKIFHLQEEAYMKFMPDGDCNDLKKMDGVLRGREIAKLYGLKPLYSHLDSIFRVYGDGYILHRKLWCDNGKLIPRHSVDDMKEYHRLVKLVYERFSDIECYQKYLKVND